MTAAAPHDQFPITTKLSPRSVADTLSRLTGLIGIDALTDALVGEDGTIRIWNPATGKQRTAATCLLTIPVHHQALALTQVDGALAVGLSTGILVLDLSIAPRTPGVT